MNNQRNTNILVLPSWYPNKLHPFAGDFIQRHVKAISLFSQQDVICVIKDEKGIVTDNITEEIFTHNNYTEKIIYYKARKTGIVLVDKYLSYQKYNRIYRKAIQEYIQLKGKPGLLHVHVSLKAGIIALWAASKWNIPFIVSEHWTVFLQGADLRVEHFSLYYRATLKKIFNRAKAVTVVSHWLGASIKKLYPSVNYQVIPNVVDDLVFFPAEKLPNNTFQFIHASTMGFQKNVEDIIKAFALLKENNYDFVLKLFGEPNIKVEKLVDMLGLKQHVVFMGEVSQTEFAREMQQSEALILYSRFETFGCVLIEANATGIPVIVSDLAVFYEILKENQTALFVKKENAVLLAEKIGEFILNRVNFNKSNIVNSTERFRFAQIGKKFNDLYVFILAAK